MLIPVIGVTTRTAPLSPSSLVSVMVQKSYTNAIRQAGGIPVLIPSEIGEDDWDQLLDRLDGILFTGGGDIAIEYFNGEPHPMVYGIDPPRDALELGFTKRAVRNKIPFLGICRGLQIVNVALGGSLFTHIPDQISSTVIHDYPGEDSLKARTALLHSVSLDIQSRLGKIILDETLQVNSLHHQGIKDLAAGLKAAAFSPDGLVEAAEIEGDFFGIAVQWHPEWLTDQAPIQRLFKAFVDAAAERCNARDAD